MRIDCPEIETERLFLREVRLSDAPSYQKNFADYNVVRTLSTQVPWPYPEDGVEVFLKKVVLPELGTGHWAWSIFLKEDRKEVIGMIQVWKKGQPENRGFWLAHKHWGNGYMTEAVFPVMDFAFDQLGFEKMIFANATGNKRSRRIKEKTGATFVKVEPSEFVDPELTEHEVWEITKENWIKFRSS